MHACKACNSVPGAGAHDFPIQLQDCATVGTAQVAYSFVTIQPATWEYSLLLHFQPLLCQPFADASGQRLVRQVLHMNRLSPHAVQLLPGMLSKCNSHGTYPFLPDSKCTPVHAFFRLPPNLARPPSCPSHHPTRQPWAVWGAAKEPSVLSIRCLRGHCDVYHTRLAPCLLRA